MAFGWFGEFVISEVSKQRHLVISGFAAMKLKYAFFCDFTSQILVVLSRRFGTK
jgi:hypothetical protein